MYDQNSHHLCVVQRAVLAICDPHHIRKVECMHHSWLKEMHTNHKTAKRFVAQSNLHSITKAYQHTAYISCVLRVVILRPTGGDPSTGLEVGHRVKDANSTHYSTC